MTSRDDESTEVSLEAAGSSLSAESIIGLKIGKYTVIQKIAKGGTATVYRAHDTVLNREVAFKILHDHLEAKREVVERFQNEARVVASLRHPNILNIFDFFEYQGRAVLVAEFMPGITLSELLKKCRKLPEAYVLMLGHEILQGLRVAHEKGITHRDIKPANILIHSEIGIKISDFGLAKIVDSDEGLTREGVFIGTPSFSSPEQIEGKKIDHRSDLFSLGLSLYMLSTGHHAFKQKGDSTTTVWFKIVRGKFQAVREIDRNISPEMERILDRSLQVDLSRRYQSAKEMADDIRQLLVKRKLYPYDEALRKYLEEPYGLEVGKAVGRRARKRRKKVLIAASFIMLLFAFGLLWWNQGRESEALDPLAETEDFVERPVEVPEEEVEESAEMEEVVAPPAEEVSRAPRPAPRSPAVPPPPRAQVGLLDQPSVVVGSQSRVVLMPSDRGFTLRFPFEGEQNFVLSSSAQLTNPILQGLYQSGGVDWRNWEEGRFYWRAGDRSGEIEVVSFDRFESSERITRRPMEVTPSRGVYDLQLNPWREELVLDWRDQPGGSNFEVLMARDESFEDVFKRETTNRKTLSIEYNWQRSQRFFWRVLFLDNFNNPINDIGRQEVILRLAGYAPRFVLVFPRPFQAVSESSLQIFAGLPRNASLRCQPLSGSGASDNWTSMRAENQSVIFQHIDIGSASRILCEMQTSESQDLFVIPLRRS